jgi:hypothetical protein
MVSARGFWPGLDIRTREPIFHLPAEAVGTKFCGTETQFGDDHGGKKQVRELVLGKSLDYGQRVAAQD